MLEMLYAVLGRLFFFTGSISEGSYPKPLSPEEEAKYLSLAKQGDKHAKDMLVKHNMRLVAHVVKKYNGAAETDDMLSVGSIGLIKAINSFEPSRGVRLATYTARCIENEILMYLRKISNQRSEVSFDEPLNTDWDGNELLLSDVLGTDNDEVCRPLEDDADRQMLINAVNTLAERERNIITLRFGLNGSSEYTQKEVADMMGISQSYISRLEKRIIVRLRREIIRQMQ